MQLDDGSLPLLAPMSEVAGPARGAGRRVVPAGTRTAAAACCCPASSGVRPGKVVILGAGIAGTSACQVAVGVGARRQHPRRQPDAAALRARHPRRPRHDGDVEPRQHRGGGARRRPGHRHGADPRRAGAEAAVARRSCAGMRPGSALVDVSIDQGGCAETSRPTTHVDPIYVERGRRPLLRDQHAGHRAAHLDARAHQRRRSATRWSSPTAASTGRSRRAGRSSARSTCAPDASSTLPSRRRFPRWPRAEARPEPPRVASPRAGTN